MSQNSETRIPDSKIAVAWGCSRQYVATQRGKGCPTDTLENATKWREANSKYGVGYRSAGKDQHAAWKSSTASDIRIHEKTGSSEEKSTDPDSSLEASLREARSIEVLAYNNAEKEKTEQTIRAYNNARDGRFQAEKLYREELERRKILVPLEDAKIRARRGYDILIPKLRALGTRLAPSLKDCTPAEIATRIDEAAERIIQESRSAYENVAA